MKIHTRGFRAICVVVLCSSWVGDLSAAATQGIEAPVGYGSEEPLPATRQTPLRYPNFPTPWWSQEISQKSLSWYRSEEGLRMTENILSWQDHGTGWPLMNTTREPFTGDASRAGPWGTKASLLKATVNEMRFLARAFRASQDERCRKAVLGGLEYILVAQHPTGGWPHSYPYRVTDYSRYATFNDDVIPDIMTFLSEVVRSLDFELVGKENRKRAQQAFDKGLAFILKSQIVVDGKLTAWAQQHDAVTYEPRPARAFEPAALTGGESAGVLHFLMSIRKPSPEVIKAVEAGVQWYRDVQINGIEVVRTGDDVVVRPNPAAPPLWARYYEIGANRPVFVGRDGVLHYSLAEVELERRRGYSWYNHNGTDVFARHQAWRHERQWDNQAPTNVDESQVGDYTLPDPLCREDGARVTTVADWEQKRRTEILRLFEQHQHGCTPTTPVKASYDIVERDVPGMGGMSRRTQARIRFPDHPEGPVIRVLVNVPANAKGPVPALLHISFSPNVLLFDEHGIDDGLAWDTRLQSLIPDRDAYLLKDVDPQHFIRRGYGIATVYYGDIEPDFDHGGKYGVRSLFGAESRVGPDQWGAIGAWAWGLSRVMDYLETDPALDARQIAVSGVSRLGKTVLWAAAQDRRFALVIPIVSGEGGAAISRRNFGESVADLTNPARYDYWYAPRYADYAFDVNTLPVDGHMLLSLIAPRPLLQIVGVSDTWSDPRGEWVAAQAAEPVYALYGRTGAKGKEYPQPGHPGLNDMGFFVHDAGHTVLPEDFEVMTDFMDRHFTNRAPCDDVCVTQDDNSFTLSNGIISARVSKASGDLVSLIYKNVETLTDVSGHPFVYWSHDVGGAERIETRVTIDPAAKDGQQAEVSVKGVSGGRLMGHGPGAPPEGDLPVDIEIRYCLTRGDQGVYTYCIFEHRPEYSAGDMTESRIAAKLQPFFDHIHVDDARSGPYPLLDEGTDKYVYTALQAENRAYGFTSLERKLGWFMIIPSAEFLSGGPMKAEFLAHGTNPTVLCYWKSSHYGGANITLAGGEAWTRVVGPILLYVNEGRDSNALWHHARKRLQQEQSFWPYDWVDGVPYAHRDERAEVTGRIVLDDPLAPEGAGWHGRLYVGLTQTPYTTGTGSGQRTITWQNDAKYYQYWTCSKGADGRFAIPHVPAGSYTLSAFADGVLGELAQGNIVVPSPGRLDLGEIRWTPLRRGRQLWEIGIANRTATEFAGGDEYFRPGSALRYAERFPDDINFVVGASDFSTGWYYAHVPHVHDSHAEIRPFLGVIGNGRAAPRRIRFQLEKAVRGRAFLRIAACGTGARPLMDLSVNGRALERIDLGRIDGALVRHQVHGIWREVETSFDAALLRQGDNTLTLTVPEGPLNAGVVYDYLRLELDAVEPPAATEPNDGLSATERYYLSLLHPEMTPGEYIRRRAEARAADAGADRRSDEAWARALPAVREWEAKGKPYIPWAAKPTDLPQARIPAFPGAWGGGMYSFGGRGGRVFVVTSLQDRGPGTFREACEAGGPRIVVFNVSGLILLKERIRIRAPYITIAGQTAPGKGVCIGGEALELDTHDVVIRHLRVRRGIVDPLRRNDSIGGHAVGNIMIDHASVSWGSDEVMSLYRHMYQPPDGGPARKLPTVNITIQYSTFAEAVNGSLHGLGATIGGHNSTFHHNLFISNKSRNPSIGMDGDFNFINNVIYNWQDRSIDGGDEKSLYQIINNYFKPGPATPANHPIRRRVLKPEARRGKDVPRDFGKAYVNGNVVEGHPEVSRDNWNGGVQLGEEYDEAEILPQIRVDRPFPMASVPVQSAGEAFETVLAEVGALLPRRDGHDQRYIHMARTGTVTLLETKGFLKDINDVGGFSEYGRYCAEPHMDSDLDGMPDAWEARFKLDPQDPSDAVRDLNGDGYTNIEKFIHHIDPTRLIDWTELENNQDTLRVLYADD